LFVKVWPAFPGASDAVSHIWNIQFLLRGTTGGSAEFSIETMSPPLVMMTPAEGTLYVIWYVRSELRTWRPIAQRALELGDFDCARRTRSGIAPQPGAQWIHLVSNPIRRTYANSHQ